MTASRRLGKAPWLRQRYQGEEVVTPSELEVLQAIWSAAAAKGGNVRVRDVSRRLGVTTTNWVHLCLRRLRTIGLVSFEDGRAATIVPTKMRFIPADKL